MAQKVCLIIGAGSTIADVSARPRKSQPPLDKKFFSIANTTNPEEVKRIALYVKETYRLDILQRENDSLEKVMAMIYTDVFDPTLEHKASMVFRALIGLFNRRLADTTNNLRATQKRYLYRIIRYYLKKEFKPDDITIITFNQDIQIEKVLYKLEQTKGYKKFGKIFNFPYCYSIPVSPANITSPSGTSKGLFERGRILSREGIRILKLHGSLNWYSTHTSRKIRPRAMFRPDRVIRMTLRQTVNPQMTYRGEHRRQCALPVIVPPVTHKSAILHNHIKPLWKNAEDALKRANQILVFGYSCPTMDFESSNLIQRSLRGNTKYEKFLIIDPDPGVLSRYIDLIKPSQVIYYPSAENFLKKT